MKERVKKDTLNVRAAQEKMARIKQEKDVKIKNAKAKAGKKRRSDTATTTCAQALYAFNVSDTLFIKTQ